MMRSVIVKPTQVKTVLARGMSSNTDAGKHMPDDLKKNSEAKIRAWIEENNKTSCQQKSSQETSCQQIPSQRPPAQPTSYQSPYGYATPQSQSQSQSKNNEGSCTIL